MEIDLNRYCDLTAHQATALRGDLHDLHAAMRDACLRDGLIAQENGHLVLTDHGAAVLARAEALMSGMSPEPPLLIVQGEPRFWPDRKRRLNAVHLKAMLALARWPGLAWRWMRSTFGTTVIQALIPEYISGEERRGAPLHLTPVGLSALEDALKQAGVSFARKP